MDFTLRVAKKDPIALLVEARKALARGQGLDELEDILIQYFNDMRESDRKLAPSSANLNYYRIRGFFKVNNVSLGPLPRTMAVSGPSFPTTRLLTQEEVKAMVESRNNTLDRALIAFLAQTGQRERVPLSLRDDMIVKFEGDDGQSPHGIVKIYQPQLDWLGYNVNKIRVPYTFVIGRDAMRLIEQLPRSSGPWLFRVDWHRVIEQVEAAAKAIGIQRRVPTAHGRKRNLITPHSLRRYWKTQMHKAGVADIVSEHMMNHKMRAAGAYDIGAFKEEMLIEAYLKAEPRLSIE